MKRLFGTDGVRGKAGEYPLDHETVARLGAALVRAMRPSGSAAADDRPLRFIIGRDTRESGDWIERELGRGVHSEGASITTAGVIPTPATAYVTRAMGFDAGLVISASHNPFEDNGIKVFSGRGEKFTETLERQGGGVVARPSCGGPARRALRSLPIGRGAFPATGRCRQWSGPTSSTPISVTRCSRFRSRSGLAASSW